MNKILLSAILATFIGTAGHAATVSFETDESGFASVGSFSGSNTGGAPQGPVDVGFSTFTVDADTFRVVSNPPGPGFNIALNGETNIEITQNVEGIGIDNNNGFLGSDNGEVDGANGNDIFLFTFTKAVRLLSVVFEQVDDNDSFVFYDPASSPNAGIADIVNPLAFPDTDGDEGSFDFGGRVVSSFGIGALGSYDNFRVSQIEIAPVPLPASGLLLLGGIAGFAGLRRRKKANKAA